MSSVQSINTPQDYVNYTFNVTSRGLTEVTSEFAGASSTISNLLGLMAFKTSEYLSHTEAMVAGMAFATTAAFASATQEAIKFEQAIANVQAIGGESINASVIGEKAMQYSNQLGMNVDSMTEGLESLARAGITATNVMAGVLEEGVKLSKLEGLDLEDSINDLIATTNLLGEISYDINSTEYSDAVKAMNQHIVSTSESSPINAQNIIQSLQHVGGYVSANKIDQDDLFAVIAQLGAKGTKGEMAGTALRAFVAAGQKDQAQRALARIGLDPSDLWDASGEAMLPISEMKQVLDNALEARGYSKQEKLEFYSDFVGYKQANQVMKINTSEVQEYKNTIANAWDLGTKLNVILGTANNNIQTLFQTVKNFMTKVGSSMLPIINAIVLPIKWTMQLVEKIPFSDKIVGIGMAFIGIKGALLLINQVVPAIASLYTSANHAEEKASGVRGHVKSIVKDLKQASEIIQNINNRRFLAQKRLQKDLFGKQSAELHKAISIELYQNTRAPKDVDFYDLPQYAKERWFEYTDSLQDTDAYQEIKNKKLSAVSTFQGLGAIIESSGQSNQEKNSEVDKWRKGNEDLVKAIEEANQPTSVEKAISEMQKYQIALSNTIKRNTDKGREVQYDVGKGIMSVAKPFSEILVETYLSKQSIKDRDIGGGISIKTSENTGDELKRIIGSIDIDYLPDAGFEFNDNIDKMEKALLQLEHDIQVAVNDFSNIDILSINEHQLRTAGKSLSLKPLPQWAQNNSINRNEGEIRHAVTTGKWLDPHDINKGIRIEQIKEIERILGIKTKRMEHDRAGRLEDINKKYQSLDDKDKDTYLQTIVAATKSQWKEYLKKRNTPSAEKTSHINIDDAVSILNELQVPIDTTINAVEQLQQVTQDFESANNYEMVNLIRSLVVASQKNDTYGIFTKNETSELQYMIEHYLMIQKAIDRKKSEYQPADSYVTITGTGDVLPALFKKQPQYSVYDGGDVEVSDVPKLVNNIDDNIAAIHSILSTWNGSFSEDEEDSNDVYDMLESGNIVIGMLPDLNNAIDRIIDFTANAAINLVNLEQGTAGTAWIDGTIALDANQTDWGDYGDINGLNLISTYIHEMGHVLLRHGARSSEELIQRDYIPEELILPNTQAVVEGYEGRQIAAELETRIFTARVMGELLGFDVPSNVFNDIAEFEAAIPNEFQKFIRRDLIDDLIENFKDISVTDEDVYRNIFEPFVKNLTIHQDVVSDAQDTIDSLQNFVANSLGVNSKIISNSAMFKKNSDTGDGYDPDMNGFHFNYDADSEDDFIKKNSDELGIELDSLPSFMDELLSDIFNANLPQRKKDSFLKRIAKGGTVLPEEIYRAEDAYISQQRKTAERTDTKMGTPNTPWLEDATTSDIDLSIDPNDPLPVEIVSFNTGLLESLSNAFDEVLSYDYVVDGDDDLTGKKSILWDIAEIAEQMSYFYNEMKKSEAAEEKQIKSSQAFSQFHITIDDLRAGQESAEEAFKQARYNLKDDRFSMFSSPLIGDPKFQDRANEQYAQLVGRFMGATITNQHAGTAVLKEILKASVKTQETIKNVKTAMEQWAQAGGDPDRPWKKVPLLEAGEAVLQITEVSTARGKELNDAFEKLIFNMETASKYFAQEDWQNQPPYWRDSRNSQWDTTIDTYVHGIPDNANIMNTPPVVMETLITEMIEKQQQRLGRELSSHEKKYWENQVRKNYAHMDANTGVLYYTGPEVDDTSLKQEQDRIKKEKQYSKVTSMPNVYGKYFNQIPSDMETPPGYKPTIWDALGDMYGEDVLDMIARQNTPIEQNLPILQGLGIHDLKSTGYEELYQALVELYGEERVNYGEGGRKSLQQLLNLHAYEMMRHNAQVELNKNDNFDEKRKQALEQDRLIQKSNLLGRAFGHSAKNLTLSSYVDIVDEQFNNSELDALSQEYAILEAGSDISGIKDMISAIALFAPLVKIPSQEGRSRNEFLQTMKLAYPELFKQVQNMTAAERKQFTKDFETGNIQTTTDKQLKALEKQYPGQFKMVSSFSEEKQKELAQNKSNMPMYQIARALTSSESNYEELSIMNDIIKALTFDNSSYTSTSSMNVDVSDHHNDAFDNVKKQNEELEQQQKELQEQIEHEANILSQIIDDVNYSAFTDTIDEIKRSIQLKADVLSIIARGKRQHEELILAEETEKENEKLTQALKDAEEYYNNSQKANTPVMGAHLVTPDVIDTANQQLETQKKIQAQQKRAALLGQIERGEYIPIHELEEANLHGWIEIQKERNAEFYKNNIQTLPLVGMGLTQQDVRTRSSGKFATEEDAQDARREENIKRFIDTLTPEEVRNRFQSLTLKKINTGVNRSERIALRMLQNRMNEDELATQMQIAEDKIHQQKVQTAQEIKAQKQKELDDAYAESQRQTEIRKKWLQKLIYTYRTFGQAGIGQILRLEDLENDEQIYIVDFLRKQKEKEKQEAEQARNDSIMDKVREKINEKDTLKEEGEKLWADIERQEQMSQDLVRIRTEEDLKNNKMLFDALNKGRKVDDWVTRVISNIKTDAGQQDFINNILELAKQNNEIAAPLLNFFAQNANQQDTQKFIQQSLDAMRDGQQIPQQYLDFILNSEYSSDYQKQQAKSYEKINADRVTEQQRRNAQKQANDRRTPYQQRLRQQAWAIRLAELEANFGGVLPTETRKGYKREFMRNFSGEDAWKVKRQELIDRGEWDTLSTRRQQQIHDDFINNFDNNQRSSITSLEELQEKQLEAQKVWLQEAFDLKKSGQWQQMSQDQRSTLKADFIEDYLNTNYAITYELRQQLEQQKLEQINAELERQKTEEYKEQKRLREEELERIREETERIRDNIKNQSDKGWNAKEEAEQRLREEKERLESVQNDLMGMIPAAQKEREKQNKAQNEKLAQQAKNAGVDNLHVMGVGIQGDALEQEKAEKQAREEQVKQARNASRTTLDVLSRSEKRKYENIDKNRELDKKRAENFAKIDEKIAKDGYEAVRVQAGVGSGMQDYLKYMSDSNNPQLVQERKKQQEAARRVAPITEFFDNTKKVIEQRASQLSNFVDNNIFKDVDDNINVFSETTDKIKEITEPLQLFNQHLEKAAQTFPILAPAVAALNTVLTITKGVTDALEYAEYALMVARIAGGAATEDMKNKEQYESAKKWADKIKQYAGEDSWITKGLGKMGEWGTKAANLIKQTVGNAFKFVANLGMEVLLPVGAAIAAIAAVIAGLWIWENRHAAALKESQARLEEATKKQQAAVISYKNAKQARENETDAIRKQQAARKEAIALYELEAARIQRRKAIHDEAKVRNDGVWGEYGLRASLQKIGLGFIAGGDFESQYENYDGTTKNVRQIKEATLGNLFATSEQRQVASFYDNNSMFLAEVEAYKQPLQELYDKESKLIEQYGDIDLARGTKEFEDAVQEFADATGVNGETAVKMLDWLETENKVSQAVKVGQAQIGMIMAERQAKLMEIQYGDQYDTDFNDVGNAMIMAQFQEMMNTAKTEVWWDLLFSYLDAIITGLNPLNWVNGELSKKMATIGVNQETLAELDAQGNDIYNSMLEAYENSERNNYGTGGVAYGDTPFGWALEADATQYAIEKQEQEYLNNGRIMSDEEIAYTQNQYQQGRYGITDETVAQEQTKEQQEEYEQAKAKKQQKSETTLGQLQNNGEQAHNDALAIIDAIKNNPGAVSGLGAGISKLLDEEVIKSVGEFSLDDMFAFMRGESGTFTERASNVVKNAKNAYAESGWAGLKEYGRGLASQGVEKVRGIAPNAVARAENAIARGRALPGRLSAEIAGARDINGWVKSGGVDMERTLFQRGVGLYDDARAALTVDNIKGLGPNAVERAKSAVSRGRGLAQQGIAGAKTLPGRLSAEIAGARDINGWVKSGGVDMERTLFQRGVGLYDDARAALTVDNIKGLGPNAVERAKGAISRGKGLIKGTNTYGRITDRIGLAREANTLAAEGVPVARNGIDKAVGFADSAKAAYADDGLKGLANFGKAAGKDGMKGLANVGKSAYGAAGGVKGIHASAMGEMKSMFNPKTLAGGVDDVAKGLKGGGSLMKGIGKLGGPALAALGPALAFAGKASELNPFEGPHYNEDGTEKKALQATGEVVGTTAGAVGGVLGGMEGAAAGAALGTAILPGIGTVVGGILGGVAGGWLGDTIFQPIGEAIGGTVGWLGDTILGGVQSVAGGAWDMITGAATSVWDTVTGANDESNNPVKGLLGLTPIGMGVNAAAGIWDWLSGGDKSKVDYGEGVKAGKQAKETQGQGNTIVIKNININTEDDPEKIKTAFMNLMIELEEQITPRQVSRIIGESNADSIGQDANTDAQNTEQTDDTTQNNTNTNTNNNNPTV